MFRFQLLCLPCSSLSGQRVLVTGAAGYIGAFNHARISVPPLRSITDWHNHTLTNLGSHVVYALQETRRYKVISIDNYHNSSPKALDRVADLARSKLSANSTAKDKDSAEIDVYKADLTKHEDIRKVFEKYGKGGIWGIIHIAVRHANPSDCHSALIQRCRLTRPWASRLRSP